ncbi:unnamed protein product [Danaus chrysippus]|uniref:(African queen) hypothetical protein n=1 Tax=Danaus chrysippus TaxID=151541 RepID=A0A8J2W2B7_9NEOP|nr:unnamed protein product [Danaus chrysippus]
MNRTFIVRYLRVPPLLFTTETPNLLGDFLSGVLFFLHAEQRADMTGSYGRGGICGGWRGTTKNEYRVIEQSTKNKERARPRRWTVTIASALELQTPCWIIESLLR